MNSLRTWEAWRSVHQPFEIGWWKERLPDHVSDPHFTSQWAAVKEFIEPVGSVLDIGCGPRTAFAPCAVIEPLASEYKKLVPSSWWEAGGVVVHQCPAEEFMSDLAGAFDTIVCWNALNHLIGWKDVLDNMLRYGSRTARFAISTDFWPAFIGHPGYEREEFFREIDDRFNIHKQQEPFNGLALALLMTAKGVRTVRASAMDVKGAHELARADTWRAGWMTSLADRAALIWLLRSIGARSVVEIGVNEGWTAACLLENVETINSYVGIDVPVDHVTPLEMQRLEVPAIVGEQALSDQRFRTITKPQGSRDVEASELGRVDVVFIDGDHSYDGVVRDTALARSVISDGGLIIWHDYGWGDVKEHVLELIAQGHTIRGVDGTGLAFERVP